MFKIGKRKVVARPANVLDDLVPPTAWVYNRFESLVKLVAEGKLTKSEAERTALEALRGCEEDY